MKKQAGGSRRDILVVGSVALDSVETARGRADEALGGSAVYFSLAARPLAPVRIIGVVGTDFPPRHRRLLADRGVNIDGLKTLQGRTFRWAGTYSGDFRSAATRDTQLNVFEKFHPELGAQDRAAGALFLANIDPDLQLDVLSQMKGVRLAACDSMNMWINCKRAMLLKLLKRMDFFFINEEEARLLTGEAGLMETGRALLRLGPKAVIVKKGDYGASLFCAGRAVSLPAFPVKNVVDTTGAGDSFGGGFMGYITGSKRPFDFGEMKKAMAWGTVMASFNVESFSVKRLAGLSRAELNRRWREYTALLAIKS
ncbi:MAG: PfkB family carbohydrate kinase [Elusimicrobiales bacterium]|nr:PfkB family carbohydrate kinase [Elusimicrobiales bacterium]